MSVAWRMISVSDPVSGRPVRMLRLQAGALEAVAVPERCMDLYEVSAAGVQLSLTDRRAAVVDEGYQCVGAESFARSFFAGMLTTCGFIQAGRPCQENGREFGLHGMASHLPARSWDIRKENDALELSAVVEERHAQGEHLRLERTYRLWDQGLSCRDRVTNLGIETPFMMMYHINFGQPFLCEGLEMQAVFDYAERRDTGLQASREEMLCMGPPRAGKAETVYYTRPRGRRITLFSPPTGLEAQLTFEGFSWMGIWKNYAPERYGLGLEPCACPGLGRVGARQRGLLVTLAPGETHASGFQLLVTETKGMEIQR